MSKPLEGKNVLITGASMGIGEAIAQAITEEGATAILWGRSKEKLDEVSEKFANTIAQEVDITNYEVIEEAIKSWSDTGAQIDILINNAGLALGAPKPFHELTISDIQTMNNTNVSGTMYVTHSVLRHCMVPTNSGTILNISSTTALEAPPFPGEAVYHANKACLEGFTNALRNELCGTNIKVLALRPGVVATHFHKQRVGYDQGMYDKFMEGFEPLQPEDVARAAVFMLSQPLNASVKALDVVPTAQRSLTVFDRDWSKRNQ